MLAPVEFGKSHLQKRGAFVAINTVASTQVQGPLDHDQYNHLFLIPAFCGGRTRVAFFVMVLP